MYIEYGYQLIQLRSPMMVCPLYITHCLPVQQFFVSSYM